jgi:2,3-bisphosphoglycerate-dependent phosphoglycerate mutase
MENNQISENVLRILFVRHGETTSNIEHRHMGQGDSPLTPTGIAQAEAVAKRLAKHQIEAIYSSDLGRAAMTSKSISNACGLPVIHDRKLRERHAGLLQGRLDAEARIEHGDAFVDIERMGAAYSFPGGGESGLQIEKRVAAFLDEVRAKHSGETIVAVTHGLALRVLLWHILGFPYEAIFRLRIDNTSISTFSFSDDRWILESWNDTTDL